MRGVKGIIHAIDYHTGGQPVRVLTGGLPPILGRTMREKADYVKNELDWIRTAVIHEPRGHKDMFAVILTEPCHPDADFGVIWIDNPGVYIGMCGHGTFGVAAMLADMGYVRRDDDPIVLTLDTPGGLVRVSIRRQPGPTTTTIENVPAFHLASATVDVEGVGPVPIDVAYGGLFFVQVDVDRLPPSLNLEQVETFVQLWPRLREATMRAVPLWHPQPQVQLEYTNSFFYQRRADGRTIKNVMVYGDGGIDRSPCGTGTCAYLATAVARGELAIGEEIRMIGSLGSEFRGRALESAPIGPDRMGIRPAITSPAFLSGTHQFILNEEDPLTYGFELPTDSGFRVASGAASGGARQASGSSL